MAKLSITQAGLFLCLLLTSSIIYISPQVGAQRVFAEEEPSESNRMLMQLSPLNSPLALAQPEGQANAASVEASELVSAKASAEEFQQQLPIYSGSRANQTSLVLIGAVIVGLVVVGTLVITRRD